MLEKTKKVLLSFSSNYEKIPMDLKYLKYLVCPYSSFYIIKMDMLAPSKMVILHKFFRKKRQSNKAQKKIILEPFFMKTKEGRDIVGDDCGQLK